MRVCGRRTPVDLVEPAGDDVVRAPRGGGPGRARRGRRRRRPSRPRSPPRGRRCAGRPRGSVDGGIDHDDGGDHARHPPLPARRAHPPTGCVTRRPGPVGPTGRSAAAVVEGRAAARAVLRRLEPAAVAAGAPHRGGPRAVEPDQPRAGRLEPAQHALDLLRGRGRQRPGAGQDGLGGREQRVDVGAGWAPRGTVPAATSRPRRTTASSQPEVGGRPGRRRAAGTSVSAVQPLQPGGGAHEGRQPVALAPRRPRSARRRRARRSAR